MNYKEIAHKAGLFNSYLVIVFAFCLPLSTAATSILGAFLIVLWIIEGSFKNKIKIILDNKIALILIVYILVHFIGLLWTEDFDSGFHVISKQWKLALMPILLTIVKKEHIKSYCYAFIIAMAISVSLSYLVWLELFDIKGVSAADPTIFMDRISYNIFLCVAIYMTFQLYMLNKNRVTFIGIIIVMTVNMFITNGRAGHMAFFTMIPILLFQYFENNIKKTLIAFIIIVPLIFVVAYNMSTNFKDRMNLTYSSIKSFPTNPKSSVGYRLTFLCNSLEIIKNNPVIGVGTGDFIIEYHQINKLKSPHIPDTDNPHNQYLLVLTQFGLLGFIVFLMLFYYQFKYAVLYQDDWKYMRFFVPFLYLVIMFGDTYLMGHRTGLLFSLLSAIYYNNLIIYSNSKVPVSG